jgi:hypothetical protein
MRSKGFFSLVLIWLFYIFIWQQFVYCYFQKFKTWTVTITLWEFEFTKLNQNLQFSIVVHCLCVCVCVQARERLHSVISNVVCQVTSCTFIIYSHFYMFKCFYSIIRFLTTLNCKQKAYLYTYVFLAHHILYRPTMNTYSEK